MRNINRSFSRSRNHNNGGGNRTGFNNRRRNSVSRSGGRSKVFLVDLTGVVMVAEEVLNKQPLIQPM